MKHFMVEVTYRISIEEIGDRLALHRAHLQKGYDRGLLLMSGPQVPKLGGVVIARADSLDELMLFFKEDPYQIQGLADYRFVEFEPVKFSNIVSDWVAGN
jgi:uncharacterized protein YciI